VVCCASVSVSPPWAYAQPGPANLLANAGFEEAQNGAPTGWTKGGNGSWSLQAGLFGDACLQLEAHAEGGQRQDAWAYSTAFPVTAGKLYLLVFWAKGPAPWPPGSDAQIYWSFKKADGAGLPQPYEECVPIAGSYCAGKWQVGHFVVRAPAEAASAQLSLHLVCTEPKGVTLQFDGLRVTQYQPPEPGPHSQFLAAVTYGEGGDQVLDPQATLGRAWHVQVGKHQPGGKISGPLIMSQEPGQYRAVFRLKIADNTLAKPVAYLRITGNDLVNVSQTAGRTILGTDFAKPGEYQDFPVELIRSPLSGLQYLVDWYGGTDMWLDGVTVREEKLLSDMDWVSLYGLPAAGPVGELGPGALVCRGLGCPSWRLEPALGLAGAQPVATHWLQTGAGGLPQLKPAFPQQVADLKPFSLVVLADVPADALGFAGRQALRQFVEAGGGLLVLGGYFSYGRGGIARSFLEDMLPVTFSSAWELTPAGTGAAVQPVKSMSLPSNLGWAPAPQCLWLHHLQAKAGAKVVLKAGDQPFLVVGEFGKGRVAACAGTVLGAPGAGQQPFWEWKDWPKVLFAAVDYLRHGRNW
jgi:uncharacterized membrane protein